MKQEKDILERMSFNQREFWDLQETDMISREASSMPKKARLWNREDWVHYLPCPLWTRRYIADLCSNPNCFYRNVDSIRSAVRAGTKLWEVLDYSFQYETMRRIRGRRLFACDVCFLDQRWCNPKLVSSLNLLNASETTLDQYEKYILDETGDVFCPDIFTVVDSII